MEVYKQDKNCSEVAEMLNEAKEKIQNHNLSDLSEDSIYETMRYFDLIDDLEKISEGEGD